MGYFMSVLFILIALSIAVGISLVALTWIHKLEEISCKCSEDFKRDYIKYFLYIYIGLFAVAAFSSILQLSGYRYKINTTVFKIFKNIFYIASLLNSIFAIIYIYRLKEIDCKCSEDVRRDIYYVLNWIYIAFVALMFLITIIILSFIGIGFYKGKISVSKY
jgi:hypothetical protein